MPTFRLTVTVATLVTVFLIFTSFSNAVNNHGTGSGLLEERKLGGPGSSPPTCRSKCGTCNPCRAVHVAIHPGLIIPLEYYPVAWRCECRSKLYMP